MSATSALQRAQAGLERLVSTLGVLAAIATLVAITALTVHGFQSFQRRADAVEHSYAVRAEMEALRALFDRVRFHWRHYFITGDAEGLSEFRHAVGALARQVDSVRTMVAHDSGQSGRLQRLEKALLDDRDALEALAARKAAGGYARSDEILAGLEQAQPAVSAISALFAEMMREEDAPLERRLRESAESERLFRWIVLGGNAAAIGLLGSAFLLLRGEIGRRRRSQAQAERLAAELDDLYNNAPCGYHSVDEDGRIVRMNDTWLKWLGYSREEVVGKLHHPELMTAESARRFREEAFPLFKKQGWLKEVEFEYVRKDGSTLPGSLQTSTIYAPDGKYLMSRTTVFDISARKRMEEDLADRARQLEALNKELESFSYSISHDLRAPLRAVDGYARMLEEDYAGRLDAEGLRLLGVVRASSRQMGQLIDDLLAFSRLGRQAMAAARVDMDRLVAEVVSELGERNPAAKLEVAPLPAARGDRALLKQVWTNLIGNALKYSAKQAQPRVQITGEAHDGQSVYRVKDNGVGFDMRYADKLFGVFQRLHRPEEFEGTGVGLAIVQRVLARHGGGVAAEGTPGQGATFSFSLPTEMRND